jgi:hypothetical protein
MRFLKVGALGMMLAVPVVGPAAAGIEPAGVNKTDASTSAPASPPILSISDQNESSDSGPFPAIGHAFHDAGHSVASGAKNVGHAVARPVRHFGHSVAAGWHSFTRNLNGDR